MQMIALCGSPNVGKSTLFNALTGQHRHTGNWAGKTVSAAQAKYDHKGRRYALVDLPGSYSLASRSPEERVSEEFLLSGEADCAVVVCDATCLERTLIPALQIMGKFEKTVVCINLIDEAAHKGITVDAAKLRKELGVPVVLTSAGRGQGLSELKETIRAVCDGFEPLRPLKLEDEHQIVRAAQALAKQTVMGGKEQCEERLDRVFLHRIFGCVSMLVLLFAVLYLTVEGANYPSQALQWCFERFGALLCKIPMPLFLRGFLLDGIYATVSRVIAVMLPPMAIFFALFALLEDFGYLPRAAFLLDNSFQRAGACGKQSLTMCMGLGCNAVGVSGCRIIDSPRERKIAVLTNSFMPCNGRFPMLMTLIAMFSASTVGQAGALMGCLLLSVAMTLAASLLLHKTLLRGEPSSFVMELPPFRRPRVVRVIVRSVVDRTLSITARAAMVAAPAGAIMWLLSQMEIGGRPALQTLAQIVDPIGRCFGLNGAILLAFVLGSPANELVMPILLMLSHGEAAFGGTRTVLCTLVFTLLHWPCLTTLWTVRNESGSWALTALAAVIPTVFGLAICLILRLLI